MSTPVQRSLLLVGADQIIRKAPHLGATRELEVEMVRDGQSCLNPWTRVHMTCRN